MTLNFKKLGSGQPLIVLHGLFGSLDNWMTLAKAWSENFEVYLVDQRNHGQSFHSDDFSYPIMAEDLSNLIEKEGIVDPIILGHSMGGKTAMEFAIKNSEMLQKLIIVDIAPVKYKVHHYAIIDALERVDLNSIKSRNEADNQLSETIKEIGTRQFLLKNLFWREKEKLDWRFNLKILKKEILPISEFDVSAGSFEKPTLFIKGSNSDYITMDYANRIGDKFPNYELDIIEGAGHWVHAEKMKEFSESVLNFLMK